MKPENDIESRLRRMFHDAAAGIHPLRPSPGPAPETRARPRAAPFRLAIGLAVCLAAAAVIAVSVDGARGPRPTSLLSSSTTDSPSTTSSPSTTDSPVTTIEQSATVTLPVVTCPTTYGVTRSPTSTTLPASVSLALPRSLVGAMAVYVDTGDIMQLLAPMGWVCTASYGADGSGGIVVHPSGESIPGTWGAGWTLAPDSSTEAIVGSETSACVGCTVGQACPLFPAAATAYQSQFGRPCPKSRPGAETEALLSPGIAAFEDPPGLSGDGIPSGGADPATGVMTFPSSASASGSWLDTCTLPAADKDTCTAAINIFVQWYGQK